MQEDVRINPDQLGQRMEPREEFTILDVRNPNAWSEATDMAAGAIRVSLDKAEQVLPHIPRTKPIVAYCT